VTPYKDPEKQAKYQTHWVTTARREWLEKQECALCGRRMNLRVFRDVGAPRLVWSKKGPSHDKFRVVCGDAVTCLQYQGEKRKVEEAKEKREKTRRKPGPKPREEAPVLQSEHKWAKESKKPDRRLVCTTRHRNGRIHGPKGTVALFGVRRFICCGRMVE